MEKSIFIACDLWGMVSKGILARKKKEEVCVHVCLCVEFNTAFNNFSVISLSGPVDNANTA